MKKIILIALIALAIYQIGNKNSPSSSNDGDGEKSKIESFIISTVKEAYEELSSVLAKN